jgi:D-sedoheptulose 7-phosphate isomerase
MSTRADLALVGRTVASAAHSGTKICPVTEADIVCRLLSRNGPSREFFTCEARRLAVLCREMAERFLDGGRLLAFGRGPWATDAQHIAVEFVHPVIVGKRALPALDISSSFEHTLPALVRRRDIVIGFGPPEGDPVVANAIAIARRRGAQTFALAGGDGDYVAPVLTHDPMMHQELIEVLYHTLWESVHVFFEHRAHGHDIGASSFLYPFLGHAQQPMEAIVDDIASSIDAKARQDEVLRARVAAMSVHAIQSAIMAINHRLDAGGTILVFGNGGSATDANDFAIDCVTPAGAMPIIPAVSLASEVASITAIANDIGSDAIFLRQIIAHSRPEDVAVAISTSGGSANIIAALAHARTRGLLTVAILGYDGGRIAREHLADIVLVVPSDDIPRIQEVQASIYHVMIEELRRLRDVR